MKKQHLTCEKSVLRNKAARFTEERAQKATQFHEAATALVKKREAEPKVSKVEIDLSNKPFSDVIKRVAKKEIANSDASKRRKAQRLVANRTKEALSPREAQVYAKEVLEAKELPQK
jgi:hypothetical protein